MLFYAAESTQRDYIATASCQQSSEHRNKSAHENSNCCRDTKILVSILCLISQKGKEKKSTVFRGGIGRAGATAEVESARSLPQDDIRRTGSVQRDANRTAAPRSAGSQLPSETPGLNGGSLRNKIQHSTREILSKLCRRGTPKFFPSRHFADNATAKLRRGSDPTPLTKAHRRAARFAPCSIRTGLRLPQPGEPRHGAEGRAVRPAPLSAQRPRPRSALSAPRRRWPRPPAPPPGPRCAPRAAELRSGPYRRPSGSDKCGGRTEEKKIIKKNNNHTRTKIHIKS